MAGMPGPAGEQVTPGAVGLTPAQAIDAATAVPRKYLNLPVPQGDEVVYERDPKADLSVLARPSSVKIAGLSTVNGRR